MTKKYTIEITRVVEECLTYEIEASSESEALSKYDSGQIIDTEYAEYPYPVSDPKYDNPEIIDVEDVEDNDTNN